MNIKKLLKVALGTGLVLLEQTDRRKKDIQESVSDHVNDFRDAAQDTFKAAGRRVGRVSKAFRNNDNRALWTALRFITGVGIGVGVGFLVAPANGKKTRTKLAEKAQELGDNVRQRFASSDLRATGTGD